MTKSSEEAIITLVSDIIATDCLVIFNNITEQSARLRKLVSYTLPIVINVTAISTSQILITNKFLNGMTTASLVSALNTACGCTVYSSISIQYISADGYCSDANNPSLQCSFGVIKINPYLSTIGGYAFNNTEITGVEFGNCELLTQIGVSAFENTYIETLDMLSCDQLAFIDDYAFAATQIMRLKLPKNLKEVGHRVFHNAPLDEVYCEIPLGIPAIKGIVQDYHVLVIGCFGYTTDYFLYPTMSISPWMTTCITVIVVTYTVFHAIILVRRSCHHFSLTYLAISLLASLDLGSDVIHLLFGIYATKALYWTSFLFVLCIPVVYFILAVVFQHQLLPHFMVKWYFGRVLYRRCKWNVLWVWLSHENGVPLINNKRQKFTFDRHDSIPKLMIFITSWLVLIVLQVISLTPFFIWVMLLSPYYLLVILVGSFLYHTKLLCDKDVWNLWVALFTGRSNRYRKDSVYDTKLMNDASYLQVTLTSLPLLVIKIINYSQNNVRGMFTAVASYGYVIRYYYEYVSLYWPLISLLISALYCVFGTYRYAYLVLRYQYLIQEVPFAVEYKDPRKKRQSIGLVVTEEDIKYNHEAILPNRKHWKNKLIRAKLDCSMKSVSKYP